jgi:hypothetical protein
MFSSCEHHPYFDAEALDIIHMNSMVLMQDDLAETEC